MQAAMEVFRRSALAVLLAVAILSACTSPDTTDGEDRPTDEPAPTPAATSTPQPSPSQGPSSPIPTTSSPGRPTAGASRTTSSPAAGRLCDTKVDSANPALRSVRFGRHDTFDRIAFDFCQPADTTLEASVVKQLIEDGSGKKVTLKGRYFFVLRLTPADAHSSDGRTTVPRQPVTVPGRNMQQYQIIGDFEGTVTYGLGVRELQETATALQVDPQDSRHVVFYFDLGRQSG
jgi:hypothetical protein